MESRNSFFAHKSNTIFALCIAIILFSGIQVKAQESEIEQLIRDVSVDSQKGAIFSYTYLMKFSYARHKFGGRKFSRLYEAIIPSRFSLSRVYAHPYVLLQDSDRNITDEEIRNSREAIAKEIEKAENEQEKKTSEAEKPKQEDGGYWTMSFSGNSQNIKVDVLHLLKNARLSNLQKKQIDGRSIVLVDFTPNPDAVFEKTLSYLSKIEGQIWIDEATKRVFRVEGFAPGTFASQKEKTDIERQKEAVFLFLQTKVAEGFWFPQTVRLNFGRHPEIFDSIEVEFTFSEYKKGSVDILYQEDKAKEGGSSTQKQ